AGHLTIPLAREDVVAPLGATVSGGSGADVMHLQVLLDLARFSPGAISGVWNENTVFAIRAFRGAAHLPPGDSADADVIARLERIAGPRSPVTEYVVTAADVRGPYRPVPNGMYAKAKASCLCYTSMLAMLGERFHATTDVIQRLNPDLSVAHAPPGTRLVVPNVERGPAPAVTRLVVDKHEGSIRGLDARGATRFWLPATVGSTSLPSPTGRLHVVSATPFPRYRYDPVVLGEDRSAGPDALLPAGPNSPVGVLWAQLSRPHVGLHGTPSPEDVGYTMSHGCVRMANWDARWLTPVLRPGLTVDFQ
ncbi:MAG TPA: L,D-transpeptidase family protein, partial [Gemmatirosa sp.]